MIHRNAKTGLGWSFVAVAAVVLFAMLLTSSAFAAEDHGGIVDSGKCGDDLTWTVYEDGLLEISGTGEMWDYGNNNYTVTTAPWAVYEPITLCIKEGVSSIGDCAFAYVVA